MSRERESTSHQAGKAETKQVMTPSAMSLAGLAALILSWPLPGDEFQEPMLEGSEESKHEASVVCPKTKPELGE